MVDSIQSPEPIYITISNLPGFRYSCSPCEPLPSSSFLSAINEFVELHVTKEREDIAAILSEIGMMLCDQSVSKNFTSRLLCLLAGQIRSKPRNPK